MGSTLSYINLLFCQVHQGDKFTLSDPTVSTGENTCLGDVSLDISILTFSLVLMLEVFTLQFVCKLLCLGGMSSFCLPLLVCLFSCLSLSCVIGYVSISECIHLGFHLLVVHSPLFLTFLVFLLLLHVQSCSCFLIYIYIYIYIIYIYIYIYIYLVTP